MDKFGKTYILDSSFYLLNKHGYPSAMIDTRINQSPTPEEHITRLKDKGWLVTKKSPREIIDSALSTLASLDQISKEFLEETRKELYDFLDKVESIPPVELDLRMLCSPHECEKHRVLVSFAETGPDAKFACKVCDKELK